MEENLFLLTTLTPRITTPTERGMTVSEADDRSNHRNYNWPVLCLFLLVILAIGGNILVCLAVRLERKLQNMFNYFLVSLALSDLLSATLVMPLSIIKALIAQLPVPKLMCVAWYSLDVLFTSSTIIHLCMISVDRYMSLTFPLRYGHVKRPKQTICKILLVWVISFCIAGPLFIFSMFDTTASTANYKGCGPETPTFIISATVTSFYLPLLIMTIMYALTVRALRQQLAEQRRLAVTNSIRSRDDSSYSMRRHSPLPSPRPNGRELLSTSSEATTKSPLICRKDAISEVSQSAGQDSTSDHLMVRQSYKRQSTEVTPSSTCSDITHLQDRESTQDTLALPTSRQKRRLTVRNFKLGRNNSTSSSGRRVLNGPDRGRRAVQVLGILFAVFVMCYLPFFLTYVISGTCYNCQPYISPKMITAFEWLAYSGSIINPIIYHIFNPDFRRAFHKLLRCKCAR